MSMTFPLETPTSMPVAQIWTFLIVAMTVIDAAKIKIELQKHRHRG
jgi:hypothetical protein